MSLTSGYQRGRRQRVTDGWHDRFERVRDVPRSPFEQGVEMAAVQALAELIFEVIGQWQGNPMSR